MDAYRGMFGTHTFDLFKNILSSFILNLYLQTLYDQMLKH